jgi:serine/threonine-protein kinase
MNWKRAGIALAWIVGGGALMVFVGAVSFCAALRSERRGAVVVVPDWTGSAREEARADAESLGLGFEVADQRHDAGLAPDRVVQQDPAGGTQVRHGRVIRVVVSLGGETLKIADIVGQPARQAEAALTRQGLSPGWESRIHDDGVPISSVMDQAPSGGTLAVPGERVHRLVSDGPRVPRWVMPDLLGRPLRQAQDWITLCGFRSGAVRRVPADGRRPGTIVGQLPLSGYPIGRRDVVELTVAQ